MPGDERGHRMLDHTADVILEAWGPDLAACCEEAVAALVETYAERGPGTSGSSAARPLGSAVRLPPASPEELVLRVLDEVVYALDTSPAVPVAATVTPRADGGLDVELQTVARAVVEPTGSVPKAIARSGLEVVHRPGRVRCRVLVDV
jgi:SHS2 domain-containing protein